MPNDTQITELLTRIRQLEREVRELAARLEPGESEADESDAPVGRRGLLKRAGAMALGVSAATTAGHLLNASPAAADRGEPMFLGVNNDSTASTFYNSDLPGDIGFQVYNLAEDANSTGIYATGGGTGLVGTALEHAGVAGLCHTSSTNYRLINRAGVGGVGGSGSTGVMGISDTGQGVVGTSQSARGGVFSGGAAAIQLKQGERSSPPAGGQTGDLYVDSRGRLWYCLKGAWTNLVDD